MLQNPLVVLWGIGNPLYGDDAAGPALANMLKTKTPLWLRVFNCETVPENYVAPLRKISPATLLIVDAADMDEDPGEIRRMGLGDFSNISFGTHGLPIDMMLEGMGINVVIIGIQPLSRDIGANISSPVRHAVGKLAELITSGKWETIGSLHQEKRSPR